MRKWLAALFLGAISVAVLAPGALASTWTVAKIPDGVVEAHLYGVSCPSVSLCVAVGGNGTVAVSTDPSGGPAAWSVAHPGGSVSPEGFKPGDSYGGGQIRGVSCPTTAMCVAGSLDGRIFTSGNPTGGTSTWNVVPLQEPKKPNVHVYGISCPSPSLCVAAAYGGKVVTSTDPLGGESAWTTTKLDQIVDLRGISCPTASLCVAVGNEGQVVSSTNPTGGAGAWTSAGAPAGGGSLNGISCPSPSLCVTGNAGQVLTSTSGNGSSWNVVNAGTGLPVEGVSCLSDAACVAVDNNSDVMVSTNPTGGQAAWLFENVISSNEGREGPADGNGMFSLSCASTSLCTAAGANHQVMVSTDPFAPDRPKLPRGRRLRRPHVVITDHPAKRLDPLRGGVKVTFRFHAIGRAAGFQCKLAGRRFRRCKSPARYRVLGGEHSFRVRALSPSGAKGPPAAFHFRVGSLSEPSPAGSCQNPGVTPGRGCINARRR